MDADDRLVDVRRVLHDILDQVGKLIGNGIADRVGQVDRGRTGRDGGFEDFTEKIAVAAGAVFRRKLHVVGQAFGVSHGILDLGQHLITIHPQLVFQVDVGSGQKGVDPGFGGIFDGAPGAVDVRFIGPAQSCDFGCLEFAGNLRDRIEIAFRCRRKAGFDDIHTQLFQLDGQSQLLRRVHTCTGRLLAVAQRRVENFNQFGHFY